jgi:hypothetical protein
MLARGLRSGGRISLVRAVAALFLLPVVSHPIPEDRDPPGEDGELRTASSLEEQGRQRFLVEVEAVEHIVGFRVLLV